MLGEGPTAISRERAEPAQGQQFRVSQMLCNRLRWFHPVSECPEGLASRACALEGAEEVGSPSLTVQVICRKRSRCPN